MALAFTQKHIREYNGDKENIFIAGHSAGAYNAVMVATQDNVLERAGARKSYIRGVIGLAGPYNFAPLDADTKPIFAGVPEAQTQPVNLIHSPQPPMLLATGEDDTTVKPRNTASLSGLLRSLGSEVEEKYYPDTAHIGIVLSLADGFRYKTTARQDIQAFIEKYKTK